jgi:hypothetical protein
MRLNYILKHHSVSLPVAVGLTMEQELLCRIVRLHGLAVEPDEAFEEAQRIKKEFQATYARVLLKSVSEPTPDLVLDAAHVQLILNSVVPISFKTSESCVAVIEELVTLGSL